MKACIIPSIAPDGCTIEGYLICSYDTGGIICPVLYQSQAVAARAAVAAGHDPYADVEHEDVIHEMQERGLYRAI